MIIDNEIILFDWDNRLSADEVINLGYDDDIRLIDILFGGK